MTSPPDMKTYRPRRAVLYRPIVKTLAGVLAIQVAIVLAGLASRGVQDVGELITRHGIIYGLLLGSSLWTCELYFLFYRKTRISADADGFSFEGGDGKVSADWESVTNVQVRQWGVVIWLDDMKFSVPFLTLEEQRTMYSAWFKKRGLSPSRESRIQSVTNAPTRSQR